METDQTEAATDDPFAGIPTGTGDVLDVSEAPEEERLGGRNPSEAAEAEAQAEADAIDPEDAEDPANQGVFDPASQTLVPPEGSEEPALPEPSAEQEAEAEAKVAEQPTPPVEEPAEAPAPEPDPEPDPPAEEPAPDPEPDPAEEEAKAKKKPAAKKSKAKDLRKYTILLADSKGKLEVKPEVEAHNEEHALRQGYAAHATDNKQVEMAAVPTRYLRVRKLKPKEKPVETRLEIS